MKEEEFKKLIKEIVNYMKKNKVRDLSLKKEPCSNRDSCWGKITFSLLNKFDRIKSLNIYNMWGNNTRNLKTIVLSALNEGNVFLKYQI
jgi:hypothetical protein